MKQYSEKRIKEIVDTEIKKQNKTQFFSNIISVLSLAVTIWVGVSANSISNTNLEYNKKMDSLIYGIDYIDGEFDYSLLKDGKDIKKISSKKMAISIYQGGLQYVCSIACNKKNIKYISPADAHTIIQTSDKISMSVEWPENFTDLNEDKIYDYIFVYIRDNSGKSYLTTFYVSLNIKDSVDGEYNNPTEIDEIEMLKNIQDKKTLDSGMQQIVDDYEFVRDKLREYR